jgi:hypothetical protein
VNNRKDEMARDLLLVVAMAALMCASAVSAGDWDGWTEGRATC